MRVLFVTHFHKLFGANKSLLTMLLSLKSKGIEPVVLIQKKGDLSEALLKAKVDYIIYPYFNQAYSRFTSIEFWLFKLKNIVNLKAKKVLKSRIQLLNFKLIYSNSSQVSIGAELASDLNLPHIWHLREFGKQDYDFYYHNGVKKFYDLLNKSSEIIAISESIKTNIQPFVKKEIKLIYNGIFNSHTKNEIPFQTFENIDIYKFIIIGLIHPTKGQMAALKAFKVVSRQNPASSLQIVGKGRRLYLLYLKIYATWHNLNVKFVNYVTNPFEIISKSHCLLMCSEFEALGRVTLEGMACGIPVIGKNQGGTPELIRNGKTGFLYNTQQELESKMLEVSNDAELSRTIGSAARAFALNGFDSEYYTDKIYLLIKSNVHIN